jgi:hypothetical protein
MKIRLIYLFSFCSTFYLSNGQDCPENNISFRTQQQIDDFKITYPNCKELIGNINIQGDDITNLQGLSEIEVIYGDISFNNNPLLANFRGLEKLKAIHGWVRMQNNIGLKNMEGLSRLKVMSGDYWYVSNSPLLEDFRGLDQLDSIYGIVHIFDNDTLKNLKGLENLIHVGENLSIFRNRNLESLDGLESLISIGKDLRLDDNDNLESIQSLDHPIAIAGWLVIRNHPLLTECSIQSVCEHLAMEGSFRAFSGNGDGCQNIATVESECLRTSAKSIEKMQMKLYPNPVVDRLYIESVDLLPPFEARIYNMAGSLCSTQIGTDWIDVSALLPGSYLVHLISGSQFHTFKFIKI